MLLSSKNARIEGTGHGIAREARGILADSLKEWAEEQMPNIGASMWSDLLNAAFGEVDWYEIAAAILSE